MKAKERKLEKGRPRRAVAIVAAVVIAIVAVAALARRDESPADGAGKATAPMVTHPASGHHPAPRPGNSIVQVVPAARYAQYPRIADTYSKAAEMPEVLDGIYCYCNCAEHAGHYSLLDCFTSDHAAGCDICLSEAEMAIRMTSRGHSLDEIRLVVDATYGG